MSGVRPDSGRTVRVPDTARCKLVIRNGRRLACDLLRDRPAAVVSFRHELLVELFRNERRLAVELLQACAGIAVEHTRVELRSIDLSQVAPTGYRADAVVVLYDRAGRPVLGVVVEVQCNDDADKRLTWPVYTTALRAQFGCAALLLVFTPDPSVAAWARRPIELGHPGFQLTPIVIELGDVPPVRDPSAASQLPELAVLSTMAHGELEIAEAAFQAILPLPEDKKRLYLDVILSTLPAVIRQVLEARMERYEYQSEFARKYYGQGRKEGQQQGREEGREQGREEGRQQGREEGMQDGLRTAVVAFARAKLTDVSDADLAAIEATSDPGALTELVTLLGQAASAVEARAALGRALDRQDRK